MPTLQSVWHGPLEQLACRYVGRHTSVLADYKRTELVVQWYGRGGLGGRSMVWYTVREPSACFIPHIYPIFPLLVTRQAFEPIPLLWLTQIRVHHMGIPSTLHRMWFSSFRR